MTTAEMGPVIGPRSRPRSRRSPSAPTRLAVWIIPYPALRPAICSHAFEGNSEPRSAILAPGRPVDHAKPATRRRCLAGEGVRQQEGLRSARLYPAARQIEGLIEAGGADLGDSAPITGTEPAPTEWAS